MEEKDIELSEDDASKLADELEKDHFLGEESHRKSTSLWYRHGEKFLEVYVTKDLNAWVFGGRITSKKPDKLI